MLVWFNKSEELKEKLTLNKVSLTRFPITFGIMIEMPTLISFHEYVSYEKYFCLTHHFRSVYSNLGRYRM